MYAESGLMYSYFQILSQQVHQVEQFCDSQEPSSSLDSTIPTSTISDYDLGAEGDLFKAPEPIIEEPNVGLDPMMASISMITCADDVMSSQAFEICDMEFLQNDQLLSDIFDGCREELLEKTSTETAVSDVMDIKYPSMGTNEVPIGESKPLCYLPFSKIGSFESLSSMELVSGATMRPNFLDFPELDFGTQRMRRAFSEGDIKTLNDGNLSLINLPLQQPLMVGSSTSEARLQQLSRYRNKKSRRNFGRKIKYACRKALADSQPRIRGRFAKTDDTDNTCKKQY